MEFSVTRISRGLVAPAEPTPSGVLELSVVDRIPVLRCNARTLHIFRQGPGAAQVIRKALSKALIPYYPLAGKLDVSDQNELQIACSGDGIWFVEALADCTLDAVNYFDHAASIPYEKLLPIPPQENDGLDPLVQMQVTQFGCKGFVIGLVFCHSICDGLGAAQFLSAVGEYARGAQQLSINPEWCRNFLPATPPHPKSSAPPPITLPDYQLQHVTIDICLDKIKELKQEFQKWSGKTCSTFEIAAALLWGERTRAIKLKNEARVQLVFFANCRPLVEPPLPKGFYGNCFFPVNITASSGRLTEGKGSENVFQVVKLIQEAKAGLPVEFGKWVNKKEGPDPFAPPLEYSTLFVSEWGRLGFQEVDYGWGSPAHIVPIQGSSVVPAGIVCSPPSPKRGVRLMTWCVQKPHLAPLLQHMDQYLMQ
ncbi:Taxadien-5-alpha-ol O-acetyltransferase [Handroanthus impetiginosus]|uniref:Taxadien-5-alpha-ol O-acetyltransferase n=1 Tax=Handroanthus impetiginosus TaxID=429701 RepID=A0A2G9HRF2_9LAMI|nr:Taxadien-5-alpha-ol O-acetyltransferase [Handroanthus impetiginosus]